MYVRINICLHSSICLSSLSRLSCLLVGLPCSSVCSSVCPLCICWSICRRSVGRWVCLSVCLSTYLPACLLACLSVYLSVRPSKCRNVGMSISIYLCVCLSKCIEVRPSVRLPVLLLRLSVFCASLFVYAYCQFVCLVFLVHLPSTRSLFICLHACVCR